ncbi:MAG: hypothetical protein COY72_02105 [Candidatus Nealsonbacteria bacterium CG_4_10_14_0_8_um_filter_35_10]|uniref:Uncharacterized protein n=1 Tax=Candidatus Nealsonbacteria bacterium CG_4_10_14_0_8_um_filter_35_10 TaxID=1974683 RepID=A0A2M7R8J0_9BACT|nr:MAG: hypothetical protein AUJ24_01820 [Parcubacteria group bacterium CG1_02_36_42]PIY90707.1 MAG: hypothetical protein COY72_02105 [Candidatus Nealsonbacteria bacterium CG_4_10_14_0_8_um_filter_35_10]
MKNTKIEEKTLLHSALEVLLKNLGPRKTTQLWQILTTSKIDYLKIRPKLFSGKSLGTIYKEAKKFNRGKF